MSFMVVGLGEALWDLFPEGPQFGGAPANFACPGMAGFAWRDHPGNCRTGQPGRPRLRGNPWTRKRDGHGSQTASPTAIPRLPPEVAAGMCPHCRELKEIVENWHRMAPTARKRILTAVIRPTLDGDGRFVPRSGVEA